MREALRSAHLHSCPANTLILSPNWIRSCKTKAMSVAIAQPYRSCLKHENMTSEERHKGMGGAGQEIQERSRQGTHPHISMRVKKCAPHLLSRTQESLSLKIPKNPCLTSPSCYKRDTRAQRSHQKAPTLPSLNALGLQHCFLMPVTSFPGTVTTATSGWHPWKCAGEREAAATISMGSPYHHFLGSTEGALKLHPIGEESSLFSLSSTKGPFPSRLHYFHLESELPLSSRFSAGITLFSLEYAWVK